MKLSVFSCLFLLVVGSSAVKDSNYYPGGNKLVNEKMYWADAENVLQDLNQFDALYVTFHNCA